MMMQSVVVLVLALFVVMLGLLVYGASAFAGGADTSHTPGGRRINMRLEVLWTGVAATILFGFFLVAH